MWFIADFLERTTVIFARTVVATLDAEARRRAMGQAKAQRTLSGGLVLPQRALCVPASIALERRAIVGPGEAPEPARALDGLVEAAEAAEAVGAAIAAARPGDVLAAIAEAAAAEPLAGLDDAAPVAIGAQVPTGVRGDVVAKYIAAFAAVPVSEAAALVDRLRKDKKVRVPELQLIVAAVLGGEVVMRKKAEHLEALRRHVVPSERRRVAAVHTVAAYAG